MRLLIYVLGAALSAACAAQNYPNRPVRVIVPLAAAGTGDTLARVVSEEMAKILGQPFLVENRPGSGGVIGTEAVAKSAPDGYTLLAASSAHAIHPALRANGSYDPVRDFEPVTIVANTHQLIVGHPSVPASNVKELVAYAKRNPGKLNYGSAGSGSATHLNMEMFKLMTGTFIVHIPYRGSTQSRQDLVAGEVQLSVDGLLPTLPLIRAGKLKAFGLTSGRRSAVAPEIPTLAEAGVTGYASDTWYGFLAAAGTPKDIVKTLHGAAIKAINTPSVHDRLTKQGAELVGSSPEEFRKLIETELVMWIRVVKETGAKVD